VELLIGVVLLGLIVLGLSGIELFCRYHFVASDRKVKVVNQATYLLEHMTKNIGQGIGTVNEPPVDGTAQPPFDTSIRAVIDSNQNAIRDADDLTVAYMFQRSTHEVFYYPDFNAAAGHGEKLGTQIRDFTVSVPANNIVEVNLTACWDASVPDSSSKHCGTPDNPGVSMQTRIYLPSVSIN
jgi:hypothetical protein